MAGKRMGSRRAAARPTKSIRAAEKHLTVSRVWKHHFLAALAETSNVTRSAEIAQVSPGRAYKVRREDPEFRRAWREALCEGYDHLEMEVLRRLREGDFNHAGGGKFDFASALRILHAHRGTVGAERMRQDAEGEEAVFAAINAKIDAMRRDKEAAEARRLPAPGEARDAS